MNRLQIKGYERSSIISSSVPVKEAIDIQRKLATLFESTITPGKSKTTLITLTFVIN